MENMKISTGTVVVKAMSSGPNTPYKNPNDVEFEVKYSEDYKGVRHMPEGKVVISKESAEQFTKAGIGKVVEPTTEPAKEEEPEAKESAEQFTKADDSESEEGFGKQKSSSKSKDKK